MTQQSRARADKTARLFSLLADPSRVLMLCAIAQRGGANVRTICELAGMSQSAASHQLRALLDEGVVRAAKTGRIVTYTIAPTGAGRQMRRLLRFI